MDLRSEGAAMTRVHEGSSSNQNSRSNDMIRARKSYRTLMVLALVAICSICVLSAASLHRGRVSVGPRKSTKPGQIHGTLYAQVDSDKNHKIALPDITVFLKDVATGKQTASVTTNERGRYQITVPGEGNYEVCWQADGWISSCDPKPMMVLNGQTRFPGMTR